MGSGIFNLWYSFRKNISLTFQCFVLRFGPIRFPHFANKVFKNLLLLSLFTWLFQSFSCVRWSCKYWISLRILKLQTLKKKRFGRCFMSFWIFSNWFHCLIKFFSIFNIHVSRLQYFHIVNNFVITLFFKLWFVNLCHARFLFQLF